jgi:hypothetical protein
MPSDAIDLLFDWQEEREAEEPAGEEFRAKGVRRADGRPRRPWPPREVTEEELAFRTTRTCTKCGVKYPETKEFYHRRKPSISHRRGRNITQSKAYWQKVCRGCGRRRQDGAWRRWANRHPFKARLSSIKGRALQKGIEWGFDYEDLREFWGTPCHYCGGEVHNRLALDRVDNNEGYVPGNVVQCCTSCNQAKSTHSVDEWVAHMERVLSHLQAGQEPPDETS